MGIALIAILVHYIYENPPCFDGYPLPCVSSRSSLKAALAGMIKSRKKGDLNAFALYKQQAIDALNQLSKQASLVINTEAAEKANEIKSGTMPTPTPTPTS